MNAIDSSISVIIPVFNGEAFLAEAVASVRRQAYSPLEIVIVDDGSTDGTARVAAGLDGIRYIYQRNSGPHAAQNTGLQLSRGNIIAFLDADDYWSDDKLVLQMPRLSEDPAVDIVLGCVQYIRLEKSQDGCTRYEKFLEPGVGTNCFGAALFRKSAFDRVGLLDPTLIFGGDLDWFLRAREMGVRMSVMPQVTLYYRLHPDNLTRRRALRESFLLRALKKSIDRRRIQSHGVPSDLPGWNYVHLPGIAPETTGRG